MSETSASRHILHLVIDGFSPEREAELRAAAAATPGALEVFRMTEANAGEALEKIFAADGVAVWGQLHGR